MKPTTGAHGEPEATTAEPLSSADESRLPAGLCQNCSNHRRKLLWLLLGSLGLLAFIVFEPSAAGWVTLLVAILIVAVAAHRSPEVRKPLYIGFGLRAMLMVAGLYLFTLPESSADAQTFEEGGWQFAQHGMGNSLRWLAHGHLAYEMGIGVLYSAVGRCPMVPLAVNVLLGTLCILETYRLSHILWGDRAGRRAAWAVALLPTPVLYSAVMLRTSALTYLAALGARLTMQWVGRPRQMTLVKAFSSFALGGILHSGITPVLLVLGIIATTGGLTRSKQTIRRGMRLIPIGIAGVGVVAVLYHYGWGLDKFAHILKATGTNTEIIRSVRSDYARSAYVPQGATSPREVLKQMPLKMVLFLFSPLPWMIRVPFHIVALADALIYWYLVYCIIRNRGRIRSSPAARSVLSIALCMILVHGLGSFNFGQAVRHRLKCLPMLMALASARWQREH